MTKRLVDVDDCIAYYKSKSLDRRQRSLLKTVLFHRTAGTVLSQSPQQELSYGSASLGSVGAVVQIKGDCNLSRSFPTE